MRRVLIADRGPIAARIARACADSGLTSIAVYADADFDARHVRLADEAYAVPGATPARSYLSGDGIIAAAGAARADAVHPGSGGLADSADFARAVRAAGFTWLGRPPEFVDRAPTPGRGSPRSRRIEVPVLADAYGTVVALGTRDASVQRRGGSLIDEAPAPALGAELERELRAAAVAAYTARGPVGRGLSGPGLINGASVAFRLDADGTPSLLDVSFRLTPAHAATEETTDIDLVVAGLRVGSGARLDPALAEQRPRGHAIAFRISAEDPGRGFLPAAGVVRGVAPAGGPGVRLDSGIEAGSAVPGGFDPLLATLTVWGPDRPAALARARRALGEFDVAGVPTVLSFHRAVLDQPAFAESERYRVHESWLETEFAAPLPDFPAGREPDADIGRTPILIDRRPGTLGLPGPR
ncbi:biotin carboxylase N-terminal domain-containing protein [Naumannella huperziae]